MKDTIYQAFVEISQKIPKKTALMYKKQGQYVGITFEELHKAVNEVAEGLLTQGIKKGTPVAIFSYNRPEWVISDLAILKLGGIVVPIYHTLPECLVKYIINDSKSKLLLVENEQLFSLVSNIRTEMPSLKEIIVFDSSGISEGSEFLRFDDLKNSRTRVANKVPTLSGNDVATYVYTSGTTGEPKGVILTHNNILSNVQSAIKRFNINARDVFCSFLPLCHMFERTAGYYSMLFAGATIAYVESVATVVFDVKKVRPTVLIVVPRILEKVYEEVVRKIAVGSVIQRSLVLGAVKNLNRYNNLKNRNRPISLWLIIKRWFYNKLVVAKFKKLAGGNLRVIVSGSAPLNKKIAKNFYNFGFNVVEGYGLTETSPVVSSNSLEENRFGTVGKPFDNVMVIIGDNDEILVKGPNLMIGYLNKPEETAKVIDNEGWFHTGDQGQFDEYGNLIITGRIKELIVSSYGKNIAPVPIEQKLSESRYIEQIMLYGDKKKCIVALIVPQRKSIENYGKENDIRFGSYAELLQTVEIKKLIASEIEKSNDCFAPHEQVKSFALLTENFTVENGLLTPTLKVRRKEIVKKYLNLIESIYKELDKVKT